MERRQNDLDFVHRFLASIGTADPPGAESVFAGHPFCTSDRNSVEIGYIFQHRFAFHYWAKWFHEAKTPEAPDLVSIDWHDDIGGDCDFDREQIVKYDFSNEMFSSLFAWAGLRPLNDGHIAPAQYLGFVRNVFVLQKQDPDEADENGSTEYEVTNMRGETVFVRQFWNVSDLLDSLRKHSSSRLTLDIDLDYFVRYPFEDERRLISEKEIDRFLDPRSELFQFIFERLSGGVTVALEPRYCGGFHNCAYLLRKFNDRWFVSTDGTYDWIHLLKK